jgi:hypothetical protein
VNKAEKALEHFHLLHFRMRGSVTLLQYSTFARSRCVCLSQILRRTNHKMADGRGRQPIEEQTLSLHHPKRYYPVKIGDLFKTQYRIIAKLGYGAYSTVWLARDERLIHLASYKP